MVKAFCVAAVVGLAACASSAEPVTSDVSGNEPAPPTPPTPHTPATPAPEPTTTSDAETVVAEVQRELALIQETHYQHTTHIVEASGVFDADCSGFVDYVLGHTASKSYDALVDEASAHARPLAVDYVNFFAGPPAASSGFTAVATVAELVPGDLVAWLEPPGAADTGHVMIVRAAPRRRTDGTFLVPVWDSVALPHGDTDSRSATKATGIGEGEVVLFVDGDGAPIAHEWSDGSAKITQQTALGRLGR